MIKKMFFVLLGVLLAQPTRGEEPNSVLEKQIDSLFAKWNNLISPGASIAILKDGKVIFSKGYGAANLEYDIPNKPNTIFDIASLSKQFTAFSIALLVQSGKITLDDDVRNYIPELHDFGKQIKVKHLLMHTSGLRDQNELLFLSGWKPDDIITNENVHHLIFKQRQLNFTPGERFLYCNSGYTLLALIVERVTKIPFHEWAYINIFKPLKMTNTFFLTSNTQIIKNKAYSYTNGEYGYEKNSLNSSTIGARGLQSTVEDLSIWLLNLSTQALGDSSVFGIYAAPENYRVKYNYGQAFTQYKNFNLIEHDGSDAGYRSYMGRFPEQNFAVIILSNLASFNPRKTALEVADIVLFKRSFSSILHLNEKEKIVIPESVEKGMEGQFQIEPDKILTIWADDHVLKATIGKQEKPYFVMPISKTEFEIKDLNVTILFRKGNFETVDSIIYRTKNSSVVLPKIFIADEESKKLSEFAGAYYSGELDVTYKISKNNNTLKVELPGDSYVNMKQQNGDNFTGSYYWFRKIKFFRNELLKVAGFELSTGRSFNMRFIKKDLNAGRD